MNFLENLAHGGTYLGSVKAARQTYYIFEMDDYFLVISFSASKAGAGNFNIVDKNAVTYVHRRIAGQHHVTSNDVRDLARRTKHVPDSLAALNILYVLVASKKATIERVGSHSKQFFNISTIQNTPGKKSPTVKKVSGKRGPKAQPKLEHVQSARQGAYRFYIVETFRNRGEPSSSELRVRPLPGQGLDTSMRVRCSKKLRDAHAIGSIFKIRAKVTNRDGGTPFLHSPHTWPYQTLSRRQATDFIRREFAG